MYKLFLTLRYLRTRRIAYFAIAAVTLCVMMVLIVLSVMGGWLEQVQRKARGMLGDVIVDNRDYAGFPLYQRFIDEISAWPEIQKATPVIHAFGLLQFKDTSQMAAIRVVGIRLHDVYEVNAFKQSLYYERFYPGTTTLAEQQQPLLGRDPSGARLRIDDLEGIRPALPEPHAAALQRARDEFAQRSGRPLEDPDSLDTSLNALLRANDLPIIPGYFDVHETDLLEPLGPPALAGDALPGLILGRDIVARRQSDGRYERLYPRGTQVYLTVVPVSQSATIDPPAKIAMRYADDSRTGIYDIDSQTVYCDFDLLQKLLHLDEAERIDPETQQVVGKSPARAMQVQIKLRGAAADLQGLCDRLRELYRSYAGQADLNLVESRLVSRVDALTWEQFQAHIIGPVKKEKNLVTILFGIISLVAIALLLCVLYMIVLQKTRDIGIVKAIGGSSTGVASIFLLYGAAVGVVGSVLGTIAGTLVVRNINEIQDALERMNPSWRVWDMTVYSFDSIPNQVDPGDVAAIVAVAILASTFGSLAAAWRAGTMRPVESIRYE